MNEKKIEEEVVEISNLRGRCALVWHTCHVSDDPEGTKLCPTISFSALCPLVMTPLDESSPNLVQRCSATRAFNKCTIWEIQELGGQNFELSEFF